ncbi:MAG: 5-dehydro-2-deoxygluconokinase [Christensenellaceae bacterium]|nr:5-dehydro-2-deoxygluconokinase [Christensenellaceae bacterium]
MLFDSSRPLDAVLVGRAAMDFNTVDFTKSFGDNPIFAKFMGGSPANTAVGMAKLGMKVGFIGRVSDDSMGDFVTDYLKECGVDTSHIKRCENGELMGLAFTATYPDGSTNLMMYRNDDVADMKLDPDDIDEAYIASAKLMVMSGTALSASPSREAAIKCLMLAKNVGTKIMFDIDYRPQSWKSRAELSVYYTIAGSFADIIIGSREEFDLMDSIIAEGDSDEQTAKRWFKQGAEILVIKHGKKGSFAYEKDGKSYKILPFLVNSIKSTGGGDAYASAFLSALINGQPLDKCLERGTASASLAVAATNCSEALPDDARLTAFIDDRHAKGEQAVFEI